MSKDNRLLSQKYVQFQNIFSIMSVIPLTLWIVLAPALVPLVFGQEYLKYVYIYFMSIFFIMKSLNFVRRVFYIYDISHNLMKIALIKYMFEFLGYIFLTPLLGLNGVLISLILSQSLYTLLLFKNVQPFLTLSPKDIIRLSFICMFFIVTTLILYFFKLNNFDVLFWVMIFANFCAYGGLLYTMKEKGYLDINASI